MDSFGFGGFVFGGFGGFFHGDFVDGILRGFLGRGGFGGGFLGFLGESCELHIGAEVGLDDGEVVEGDGAAVVDVALEVGGVGVVEVGEDDHFIHGVDFAVEVDVAEEGFYGRGG